MDEVAMYYTHFTIVEMEENYVHAENGSGSRFEVFSARRKDSIWVAVANPIKSVYEYQEGWTHNLGYYSSKTNIPMDNLGDLLGVVMSICTLTGSLYFYENGKRYVI